MAKIPTNEGRGASAQTGGANAFISAGIVNSGTGAMGINLRGPSPTLLSTPNFMGAVPEVRGLTADPGYDQIGRNIASATGAVLNAGEMYARHQAAQQSYNDGMWVEKEEMSSHKKWLTYFEENETNREFTTKSFMEGFDRVRQAQLESAPTEKARQQLEVSLGRLELQLLERSLNIEAKNRAESSISDFNTLIQDAGEVTRKSGDIMVLYEQQAKLYQALDTAAKLNKLPPKVVESVGQSIDRLATDFAEYLIPNNPDAAKHIIENDPRMPLNVKTALRARLETSNKTADSLMVYQQDKSLEANLAQIETTGEPSGSFDMAAYKAVRGEAHALRAADMIESRKTVYTGMQEMMAKTPGELNQILSKYAPSKEDPKYADKLEVYQKLAKHADDQARLLQKDPFAYSLQDPVVKEAYKSAAESNDPVVLQSAISISMVKQKELGVPADSLAAITSEEARGIARKINAGDPSSIENELKGLMSTYGQYYPDVFRNILGLPEDERIDTKHQIIALHFGKPWLSTFIQSLKIKDSELNFDPEDTREIEDALSSAPQLENFRLAATRSNFAMAPFVNDMRGAISKYAKFLLYSGAHTTPSKAVDEAAEHIISSEYSFREHNGVKYAIKRNFVSANGKAVAMEDQNPGFFSGAFGTNNGKTRGIGDVDMVASRLAAITRQEPTVWERLGGAIQYTGKKYKITPENVDTSRFGFDPNLSEEAKTETVRDIIRNHAFWVLAPDNRGFHLYIPGLNNTSAPIKLKSGETYYVPADFHDEEFEPLGEESMYGF